VGWVTIPTSPEGHFPPRPPKNGKKVGWVASKLIGTRVAAAAAGGRAHLGGGCFMLLILASLPSNPVELVYVEHV
jgi:hypothetical protein